MGHLKRWYYYHPLRQSISAEQGEAQREFGDKAELYRCERCHNLYRPLAADVSTAGQRFETRPVTLWGDFWAGKANRDK